MAVSKIRHDNEYQFFTTNIVKTWFDSSLIDFTDNCVVTIAIRNNIAFVRLDGLKIKQTMSSTTSIIVGLMPMPDQASLVEVTNDDGTKKVTCRVYRDSGNLFIRCVGYSVNSELPTITFSYPVKYS